MVKWVASKKIIKKKQNKTKENEEKTQRQTIVGTITNESTSMAFTIVLRVERIISRRLEKFLLKVT